MMEEKAISRSWENCPACGYHNEEDEVRCEKCGRRLHARGSSWQATRATGRTQDSIGGSHAGPPVSGPREAHPAAGKRPSADPSGKSAPAPRPGVWGQEHLRRQLSTRVQDFRSRRLHRSLPLPFEGQKPRSEKVIPIGRSSSPPAPTPGPAATPSRQRRALPQIQQQPLNFPAAPGHTEDFLALPVAPFRLRLVGHGADFALSLAAMLVFLLPLRLLAGPVLLNRFLVMGGCCAYLLLVLLYGIFFLYLAGATPTMKWIGLRLVDFDGMPPPRRQLLCRFLGAIASVGSFFLGFLWAAVDEERLSWHDRISKTFLTLGNKEQGKGKRK